MLHGKKRLFPLLILLCGIGLAACSGTLPRHADPNEGIGLTDRWDAADSRLVAEEMAAEMLSFPWIAKWRATHPENPQATILVLGIQSPRKDISADVLIHDLKRAMVRSGAVDFTTEDGKLRKDILAKLQNRDFDTTPETITAIAWETDADFGLYGSVVFHEERENRVRATKYQVDLRLMDMTTGLDVWFGQKEIRKFKKRKES